MGVNCYVVILTFVIASFTLNLIAVDIRCVRIDYTINAGRSRAFLYFYRILYRRSRSS